MANEDMIKEWESPMYDNMEDRLMMHNAICEHLGDDNTAETYVRFCKERCIDIPIMPPAYGWEI